MNWFERHLNWVAVIIPILSCILGFMLGEIYRYLSGHYIYSVLLPGEFGFLTTVTLSSIGVFWVLRRKNRNPVLLICFLPVFIIAVIAQAINMEYNLWNGFSNPIIAMAAFFASILWIIGWIILLSLKSRPKRDVSISTTNDIVSKINSFLRVFSRPFRRNPQFTYILIFTVIALIITFGIISGNSYLGRDCSYTTHSEKVRSASSNMLFTFEYPQCFNKMGGVSMDDYPSEAGIGLFRDKRRWFSDDIGVWISVDVRSAEYFRFVPSMSIAEKAVTHFFGVDTDYSDINVLRTKQVTIANISADYVILSVEKVKELFFHGIARFIYFEHNDLVWVITMYEETTDHEQYFNHLIESFKITDKR